MVAGAVTLTGRSGVPPLTVAGLVGLGAVSALVVGMSGVLVDRMAPERDAVAGAEKAVAECADDPGNPDRRHRASSALHAAWAALHDAQAVRGGVILDGPRRDLAERAMVMRATMVRLVGDDGAGAGAGTSSSGNGGPGIAERAAADQARPHTAMAPLARPGWSYRVLRSAGLRRGGGGAVGAAAPGCRGRPARACGGPSMNWSRRGRRRVAPTRSCCGVATCSSSATATSTPRRMRLMTCPNGRPGTGPGTWRPGRRATRLCRGGEARR